MAQALAIVILLLIVMWGWDKIKTGGAKPVGKTKKGGEVIDISEAWIPMDNLPYQRRGQLLEGKEMELYQRLGGWLRDKGYLVLPRVRLADILSLPPNVENRQAYWSRLREKSADFLICQGDDLRPVLIVVTEGTVEGKKKQITDNFVRRAAEAAGVPCLTINVDHPPGEDVLLRQLNIR